MPLFTKVKARPKVKPIKGWSSSYSPKVKHSAEAKESRSSTYKGTQILAFYRSSGRPAHNLSSNVSEYNVTVFWQGKQKNFKTMAAARAFIDKATVKNDEIKYRMKRK